MAAAVLARLWLLITRPLWYDEIFTSWAARLTTARLIEALRLDSGPPLFYGLARPIVLLAERLSAPDTAARTLSLLAALALFLFARALPDAAARRRYLVLAAASPLLLLYSAEARPYSLLSLEGLALFLVVLRGAERTGRLAAASLLAASALYTHYLALFLVAALAGVALARGRRRSVAALAGGAVLFLPWLPVLARQPAAATAWMREPLALSAAGFFSALGGAGRVPAPFGGPLPATLVWAGAAIGLLGLAGLVVSGSREPEARDAVVVSLLALGAVLAASAFRPIAFAGRTELVVLPIWLWGLASAGTTGRLARIARAAACFAGLVSCALLLSAPRGTPFYSERAAQIGALARPGDLLVAGGSFYLPARLAADRGVLRARLVAVPAELAEHPGWIPAALASPADLSQLDRDLAALPPAARAYVLLPSLLATPELREALARSRSTRVLTQDPGVFAAVLEAR